MKFLRLSHWKKTKHRTVSFEFKMIAHDSHYGKVNYNTGSLHILMSGKK